MPTIPLPGIAYFDFEVLGDKIERDDMDLVARNGAFHVVPAVLNPLQSIEDNGDPDKTWENWEEWLPRWARDN
jgi:hypothetical protein